MNQTLKFSEYSMLESETGEIIHSITLNRSDADYDNRPKKPPIESTDQERELMSLGLIPPIPELEDFSINQITIKYKVGVERSKYGVSDVYLELISAIMHIEYAMAVGEDDLETIEIEVIDESPNINSRTIVELLYLPYEPSSVTVDMKHGWDKDKFEYTVILGNFKN
jgi:hypothetical protein